MNLLSLLTPFLQQALQKPLQKAVTWAYRQGDGKAHGDAVEAQNQPFVDAAEGLVTSSLVQAATAHLDNDKLAGKLGIPTTEQGIIAVAASAITGQSTLDLSQQGLLANFLEQKIVQTTQPH